MGGQALVDGVMMRRGDVWAGAVRDPDGEIQTIRRSHRPALPALRRWPLLRGMGALVDSLRLGLTAMRWSRRITEGDTAEDSTPWRERLTVLAVVSVVLAAFLLVPLGAAAVAVDWGVPSALGALVEGLVRLGLFIAYLAMISRMPGLAATLQYHGAEHMTIAGYEHGAPRTVEATRAHSERHPRCGTDFFLLIFVVSIVVFAVLGELPVTWLVISRIVAAPVIVGISYEILRAAGTSSHAWLARILGAPGLALQRFTTAEPTDDQIDVAIAALETLLDDGSADGVDPPGASGRDEAVAV